MLWVRVQVLLFVFFSSLTYCVFFSKLHPLSAIFSSLLGFSQWPWEHSEVHVRLMVFFHSSSDPLPPALPFSTNTFYFHHPAHISCMFSTTVFVLVYVTNCKNAFDILVSGGHVCGHFCFFLLESYVKGDEKILFPAFICYVLKVRWVWHF